MNEIAAAAERLRAMPEAELDRICRGHAVRILTMFGSAARGRFSQPDPNPNDLDVGVMFEPLSSHDVLGLLETLVATLEIEKVDVLDAERASETARLRAIADGEAIYQSEPMAYANAVMAAEALFMETAHMRREALSSLSE